MRMPTITVGTDGAEPGTAAVRWAAREAVRQDLPLRIVHVIDGDLAVARHDLGGEHFAVARQRARAVVHRANRVAIEAVPALTLVELQVRVGRPLAQLLNASAGAAQLVIGTRDRHGITEKLLGSISRRATARASCPMVVVRGRHDPATGPVATGVDDSDAADAVLDAAFAAAAARDTTLVMVRSCTPSPMLDPEGPEPETAERYRITQRLAPWQAKYPQVPVETLVSQESPAETLAEISHGTRLIVVGVHGHGRLSGKLLGSTVTRLMRHADCPVLVVRP